MQPDPAGSAVFIGIDVSKAACDLAVHGSPEWWRHERTEEGLAALREQIRALGPTLVVLEATGGYEAPLAVAALGVPVAIVNARQVTLACPRCVTSPAPAAASPRPTASTPPCSPASPSW